MNTREKLIVLIMESVNGCARNWAEVIADHLIENGIIVPPCKVGDTVYIPLLSTVIEKKVFSIVVQKPFYTVYCGGTSLRFSAEDFGKNVFFTREEAEKVIAERGK